MGQMEQGLEQGLDRGLARGWSERGRGAAAFEAGVAWRNGDEGLAEVAHDARNMVSALGLYCDLLEEPGVLAEPFRHYGGELRLVAAASRQLMDKLAALDSQWSPLGQLPPPGQRSLFGEEPERLSRPEPGAGAKPGFDLLPSLPIADLGAELLLSRNLLSALAGPRVSVTLDLEGEPAPVWLTGEDLTRMLVNLVRNSAEAMTAGGNIRIALGWEAKEGRTVTLTVEDNGPGLPPEALERIFESGFSGHSRPAGGAGGWTGTHRGLGLAITRSIVEGAGGSIRAANRSEGGARFEIALPLRKR